ncbi:hypothetical protein TrVE_jg9624 [Triparma verrucosa]|uniref:Uncharacterized protein n=1 Tax=Triparma verrucosa TaxID=1606542 RepID=A0A9W7FKL0_9STRA|nr:hypothetical protein TrVE_jg9624 [Triparma verrucosa]
MSARKAAARRRERILAAKKERMDIVDPDGVLASDDINADHYSNDHSSDQSNTINTDVDKLAEDVKEVNLTRDTDGLLDAAFDEVLSSPPPEAAPTPNKAPSVPVVPDPDDSPAPTSTSTSTSTVPVVPDPDDDDDVPSSPVPISSPLPSSVPVVADPDDELTEEEKEKLKAEKMKRYRAARFKKKKREAQAEREKEEAKEQTKEQTKEEEAEEPSLLPTTTSTDSADSTNSSSTSPKRKFKGVAATRRARNKEAALAAAAASPPPPPTTATVHKKKPRSSPLPSKTLEIITTLLLLTSGYILGTSSLQSSFLTPSGITYATMSGIPTDYTGRTLSSIYDSEDISESSSSLLLKAKLKPVGASSSSYIWEDDEVPEIEPEGDAITSFIHFIESTFMKLLHLPLSFIPKCVPTFLVLAGTVRLSCCAIVGFKSGEKDEAEKGDLLGMAMNMVKGMFPKVFMAYNVYQTVVGDILMVAFGMLWGVATFVPDEEGGRHGGVFMNLLGIKGERGGGGEL